MTAKSGCSINFFLFLFCCAIASSLPAQSSTPIEKVVVISVDTLRADYLGCYNPRMKTSPEIDHLASRSVIFRNVTSQAPTTAPSHKSIFYSLYPSIHKTTIKSVPREEGKSPVEVIRDAGFKTAAFTGGGQLSRSFGFSRGFDTYWEPPVGPGIKHPIPDMEAAAFDWLQKHYRDKFFLFLHTYETHCPYDPPQKFFQKWSAWYQGAMPKDKCYPQRSLPHLMEEDLLYVKSLYSAEVNYADTFVGDVIRKLKMLGIYEKTLIIFLSDHGESLGENDYIGHSQLYDVQLRVPLILYIPGVHSMKIDAPIESIDVMPTVFDLLRITNRAYSFQGKTLIPLVRKPSVYDRNRPMISEERGRARIRIGDYALCFFPQGESREELFHLKTDPQEAEDISRTNPGRVEQMKRRYFEAMSGSSQISQQFYLEDPQKAVMDEETKEQLRALGYIQDSSDR